MKIALGILVIALIVATVEAALLFIYLRPPTATPLPAGSIPYVSWQQRACTIGIVGRSTAITFEGRGADEWCAKQVSYNGARQPTYVASAEPTNVPVICEYQVVNGVHVRVRQANPELLGGDAVCRAVEDSLPH
jgi:hypothetical protein